MTAFYIYARKIKISLFVMAKYRFWAAFSRGKVHDKILAQDMSQAIDWVQIVRTAACLMVGDNDVYERTLI